MNCDNLINKFKTWDISTISKYKALISTQDDKGIFPPYIPYIGSKYEKFKIFVYAMAQNISPKDSYLNNTTAKEKVNRLYQNIAIAPFPIILGLVGLYIYIKQKVKIENFSEIKNYMAITNYYKFSLHDGNRDINPNNKLVNYESPDSYWSLNDELSSRELEELKPNDIISFQGRHNKILRKNKYNVIEISDPAFILYGGYGHFSKDGSYYEKAKKVKNEEIINLVKIYSEQVNGEYKIKNKINSVEIYFLKYYHEWQTQLMKD